LLNRLREGSTVYAIDDKAVSNVVEDVIVQHLEQGGWNAEFSAPNNMQVPIHAFVLLGNKHLEPELKIAVFVQFCGGQCQQFGFVST